MTVQVCFCFSWLKSRRKVVSTGETGKTHAYLRHIPHVFSLTGILRGVNYKNDQYIELCQGVPLFVSATTKSGSSSDFPVHSGDVWHGTADGTYPHRNIKIMVLTTYLRDVFIQACRYRRLFLVRLCEFPSHYV